MKYLPLKIFFVILVLTLTIFWKIYSYKECLRIGHIKTYCILNIGNR